jgi:hypothetical protein
MKSDCAKFRDRLLEAVLTGSTETGLALHLQHCADCASELAALQARRKRLDTLLPLLARGAEPSAGFRARVLAAAEGASERRRRPWRVWVLAGVTAAVAAALILEQRASRMAEDAEIVAAERLAEWRAPSDVLLQTPGQEILRTTPKLGESYLKGLAQKDKEN